MDCLADAGDLIEEAADCRRRVSRYSPNGTVNLTLSNQTDQLQHLSSGVELRDVAPHLVGARAHFAEQMMDVATLKEMLGKKYDPPRFCKDDMGDVSACINVSGL